MGGKGFLSAHINCRQKYVVPCCETRKLAFNETTSACNQRTVVQLFFAKATGSTKGLLKKNTFKTKFEKKKLLPSKWKNFSSNWLADRERRSDWQVILPYCMLR
jgi:hypothetical protein